MSDLNSGATRDPIQQLESFGNGGIAVNPLDPAAVRRLGDQRRRRQHAVYGAIAAVVVTAAVVPAAILATRNSGEPTPTPPGPTSSVTPSPSPSEPFPADGVTIRSEADLAKLVGTSDEFKAFIGSTLAANRTADCPNAEIGVTKYDSTGFALGNVGGCGGYVALWSIQNGSWKEAIGTQDEWRCGDLARFSVPEGFAGECYGSSRLFGPDQVGSVRIGMTVEEARAAGAVVEGSGVDGCTTYQVPADAATGTKAYGGYAYNGRIASIFAPRDMLTPAGIGLGSTEKDLRAAYPDGSYDIHHYWLSSIDAETEYSFGVEGDGTVGEMLIQTKDVHCYS